jgi:hypothetical protein
MERQNAFFWLILGAFLPATAMWMGGSRGLPLLSGSAAAFALLILLMHAVKANWLGAPGVKAPNQTAARNAELMALVYGFGAVVILTVYSLTPLRWYHFWQYGGAMALLAIGLYHYGIALGRGGALASSSALRIATLLTALQGAAAAIGLIFLIGSGKLATTRPDWLANQIFLFGGIGIVALSAMAVASQLRSTR